MLLEQVVKWVMVAMMAFGALTSITMVGKPRKPLDGTTAAVIVVAQAAYITAILTMWD